VLFLWGEDNMPFRKIGSGKYVSPSGRKWTKKQVIAYYASGGTFSKAKKKVKKVKRRR
jgi:hypothetical protein